VPRAVLHEGDQPLELADLGAGELSHACISSRAGRGWLRSVAPLTL
jgi:hypothetical protein